MCFLFTGKMEILLVLFLVTTANSLHCEKDFNYYDSYGNGFDITCQDITSNYINVLKNITVSQEISLTIKNSNLSDVHSDIFRRVSHLKHLFIFNSIFSFSRKEQIFKYLNSLEHLEVKDTMLDVSNDTLVGLDHLKTLVLSNNNLSNVQPGSFRHLTNLRKLDITSNKISSFETLPLCEIRDLDALNVSRNSISLLKVPDFHCRIFTEPLDIKLNNQSYTLNIKTNYQSLIDYGLRLTSIDLSYNKISTVGDILSNFKFVKKLRLEGNSLNQIKKLELLHLSDLEEIYLQNNNLNMIDESVFTDKDVLQHIDISHNKLSVFIVNELPRLDSLNLGFNKLSNFSIDGSETKKSIKYLFLNNNRFSKFGPHVFEWYFSLELLDLADNKIVLGEQSLNGLTKLRILNLRNNNIEELFRNTFSSLTNLRILDLSHNRLRSLTFNNTFQYLRNLETLNISYNLLEDLNYDIFDPLGNLRVLDVSGNRLKEIQYELILSNLKLLSVLDIKSNLLSCETLYRIIQYLKRKNVNYTLVEKFDYEKENVAGIYCTNEQSTLEILSAGSNVLVNLSVVITILFILIIMCIALFKMYIYLKRRKYRPDEFELIN